jgi:HAD superfamily hydrolase (TIGR01509 family)
MIAVVGQSVIDRVKLPGQPWVERLGGAPLFAGEVLASAGARAVILTRGATPHLRRPLHALGLRVVEGPATRTCISEMVLFPDGGCADSFRAFGEPFTPADVASWMAPGLAGAAGVVCGAQWRDDFPPSTLAALAGPGRHLYLDGQGPLRMPRLGPVCLQGPLSPAVLRHVTVLKLAQDEAEVALGGVDAGAALRLGVPVVVVTLGERGAVVLAGGRATPVDVEPVRHLADTVGAGDAFLALMAAAATDGAAPAEAARVACAGTAELLRRRLPETTPVHPRPLALAGRARSGPTRPAAVLFDFGGTLDADGVTWNERAYRLFRATGATATRAQFDAVFYRADDALVGTVAATLPLEGTVARLFRAVAEAIPLPDPVASADRLAARFLEESRARLRRNASLLRRLATRYRLGLVSNFYGNLTAVSEEAGLRAWLATLVDSAVVGCRKPDPAIFHAALADLGIPPEAALFVGDSLRRDMAGARAIGMPHVWLHPLPAPGSPGDASGPGPCCPGDCVISSLAELERLLS